MAKPLFWRPTLSPRLDQEKKGRRLRRPSLERLEDRLLLHADPVLSLRAQDALGVSVEIDTQRQSLSWFEGTDLIDSFGWDEIQDTVTIVGSEFDDTLRFHSDSWDSVPFEIRLEGSGGSDSLKLEGSHLEWTIDGVDSGHVNAGGLAFTGIEHVSGADEGVDRFQILSGGVITGGIDGGAGPHDVLELVGQSTSTVLSWSDAYSGFVESRTEAKIPFKGMDRVSFGRMVPNLTLIGTPLSDDVTVFDNGLVDNMSTMLLGITPIDFMMPTNSLTFDLLAGDDEFEFQSIDAMFDAAFIVDGGDDVDEVLMDGPLTTSASDILIQGEQITVASGVILAAGSGDIILDADAEVLSNAEDLTAAVSVTGAALSANQITVTADTTLVDSLTGTTTALIAETLGGSIDSLADILIDDSALIATGDVSIMAASSVDTEVTAQASTVGSALNIDAAIARTNLDSTARSRIVGTTTLFAGGAVLIQADNSVEADTMTDGSTGDKGGSLAFATVNTATEAILDDSVSVTVAGNLSVLATSWSDIATQAVSTSEGAEQNNADTQQLLIDQNVESGGKSVDVVAAFAINNIDDNTVAAINSSGTINASGMLTVDASALTHAAAEAEASSTNGTTGFGVAASVNVSDTVDRAYIDGGGDITASDVIVSADMHSVGGSDEHLADSRAISGVGQRRCLGGGQPRDQPFGDRSSGTIRGCGPSIWGEAASMWSLRGKANQRQPAWLGRCRDWGSERPWRLTCPTTSHPRMSTDQLSMTCPTSACRRPECMTSMPPPRPERYPRMGLDSLHPRRWCCRRER